MRADRKRGMHWGNLIDTPQDSEGAKKWNKTSQLHVGTIPHHLKMTVQSHHTTLCMYNVQYIFSSYKSTPEFSASWSFIIDVGSTLATLHRMDMCSVNKVSEVNYASIFRVELIRVSVYVCIGFYWMNPQGRSWAGWCTALDNRYSGQGNISVSPFPSPPVYEQFWSLHSLPSLSSQQQRRLSCIALGRH
jgi:hypothetical protein